MTQVNHELENIIGVSGDVRILRTCDSKICNRATRIFDRVGQSTDKAYWIYHCQRCENTYLLPTKIADRLLRRT